MPPVYPSFGGQPTLVIGRDTVLCHMRESDSLCLSVGEAFHMAQLVRALCWAQRCKGSPEEATQAGLGMGVTGFLQGHLKVTGHMLFCPGGVTFLLTLQLLSFGGKLVVQALPPPATFLTCEGSGSQLTRELDCGFHSGLRGLCINHIVAKP